MKRPVAAETTRSLRFLIVSYFHFYRRCRTSEKKKKKDRVNASKRFHCHWQRARKHTHAATLREIREIVAQAGAFDLRESRK